MAIFIKRKRWDDVDSQPRITKQCYSVLGVVAHSHASRNPPLNFRHDKMDDSELEKASIESDSRPSKLSLWFSQWWHQPPNIWYRRRLLIVLLLTGACALLSLNQLLHDLDDFISPEAARRLKASWAPFTTMDTSIPPTPMPSAPSPWLVEPRLSSANSPNSL